MSGWTIGIIGGSGLDAIDALKDPRWITIATPWGVPSDQLLTGTIGAVSFVFLPRVLRTWVMLHSHFPVHGIAV